VGADGWVGLEVEYFEIRVEIIEDVFESVITGEAIFMVRCVGSNFEK
jgi:hypothetical protein